MSEQKRWWIWFGPKEAFLGCMLCEGGSISQCTSDAWLKEVNPGGEVRGIPVPEGEDAAKLIEPWILYSVKEVINAGGPAPEFS